MSPHHPIGRLGIFAALMLTAMTAAGCLERASSEAEIAAVSSGPPEPRPVTALGRLEPEDGIYQIAGPSNASSVISELRVKEGDAVAKGDILAVLDTVPMLQADVARLRAELANAQNERARHLELNTNDVVSDALREARETQVDVVAARLAHARAELERAHVRAPIDGRVLYVHAREGERVGEQGIVELGKTDHMFAIAEVYEDDVSRVRVGQRARVSSPALPADLSGKVEWVHLRVAKQDSLGTDPAARKDARVVEVEVRLDESEPAAGLTNLQVEIEIEP